MATRILRKLTNEPSTNIAQAAKELKLVVGQLEGLKMFLDNLGEAQTHGSNIPSLDDLCFGFCFLLRATEASAQRALELLTGKEAASA